MHRSIKKGFVCAFGSVALLFGLGVSAKAVPVFGTINLASNYSLMHDAQLNNADDWLWFDAGQSISMDLTAGILTLTGPQSYSLASNNGAAATLQLTDMFVDLNNIDRFLNGTLDYLLNGLARQSVFARSNYGSSPFNSSYIVGKELSVYAWGGDDRNALGSDLGISGTIGVPPTLLLLAVGALALRSGNRGQTTFF